jgi:hypothetical protein
MGSLGALFTRVRGSRILGSLRAPGPAVLPISRLKLDDRADLDLAVRRRRIRLAHSTASSTSATSTTYSPATTSPDFATPPSSVLACPSLMLAVRAVLCGWNPVSYTNAPESLISVSRASQLLTSPSAGPAWAGRGNTRAQTSRVLPLPNNSVHPDVHDSLARKDTCSTGRLFTRVRRRLVLRTSP